MQDFETSTDDAESADGEPSPARERLRAASKTFLRRFIIFISFGPGILGFLWLLGRIFGR